MPPAQEGYENPPLAPPLARRTVPDSDEGTATAADGDGGDKSWLGLRPASTRGFRARGHDSLLAMLRGKADERLPGKPKGVLFQSLQDSGCDLLIEWGGGAKYGVQLKSHFDISQDQFQSTTIIHIHDSRAHGLKRLYVLFAGDLTDRSYVQKLRGFESRVNKMDDSYIETVSPEPLWTLLFGK
jgi:hypothetical protein